jgi:hypothetical protein
MPPKERGEVTLVRASDLGTDFDKGHVGLGQQPLGVLYPAQIYVLVGRQPGGVLELVRKMGRAHLRHGGKHLHGELLLQMGLDIGERTSQLVRGEPAGHLAPGWLSGGIASEEVDRKRIGQRLSVQLPLLALGVDGCLQRQRDMVLERVVDGQVEH